MSKHDIGILDAEPQPRPKGATFAERVCQVIEGMAAESMRDDDDLVSAMYQFAHLASPCGQRNHAAWRKQFEEVEERMILGKVISDIR